jgi:hypothetical protein
VISLGGALGAPFELGPSAIGRRAPDEPLRLGLGIRRVVVAETVIAAFGPDADLAGWFVEGVGGDVLAARKVCGLQMGAGRVLPRIYHHFQSTLVAPPWGRVRDKSSLRQDLQSVGATGFEPVTSSTPS